MAVDNSSPTQEYGATKTDSGELEPAAQPDDNLTRRESSDDDMPIMARRQLREPPTKHESMVLRERRSARDKGRDAIDYASNNRPSRQASKPSPVKERKKPGPRAWAAKPIMKNDMVAKQAVIREIESYWGKGFIRSYIPKCHRPLVKRGKHGKRSSYRDHETDPKKWLPSVLKAVLMIAKLTDDKTWLRSAMNEVVRYRIKHTGNRKPQLVTTDFDVIEDMLVKQWAVSYAFEIRYKHLLVNRKDQEETDEDIDHILGVGSGQDNSGSDDDDDNDDEDQDDEDEDEGEEDDEDQSHDRISGRYLQSSGYTMGLQASPSIPRQPIKQQKSSKPNLAKATRVKKTPPQPHGMYGYGGQMPGYGPPIMDPWGRQTPAYGGADNYGGSGGFGAYGGYGGYGGYGPPPYPIKQEGREASQQPPHYGMYPPHRHPMTPAPIAPDYELSGPHGHFNPRSHILPPGKNVRVRDGYEQNSSFDMNRPDMQGHLGAQPGGARFKIKRESPAGDDRIISLMDLDSPTNELGPEDDVDADEASDVDAEVEAAELELKLARLRAKQAALKKAKLA